MKKFMLMRHGAYDSSTGNLSEAGREAVDYVAEEIAESGLIPDVIIHSPVPRAVETAKRVQAVFNRVAGRDIPLVKNHDLEVGDTTPQQLFIPVNDNVNFFLAVTHQPNVESLTEKFGRYVSPGTAEANLFEAEADRWARISRATLIRKFR